MKTHCLLVKVAFLIVLASVQSLQAAQPTARIDECLQQAAQYHQVAYPLLRAIAEQESGFSSTASNINKDGSADYGLMQINSRWLPTLSTWGITRQALFDPCVNAHIGAWILSKNFQRWGANWTAVGAYNATSDDKRAKYAWAVYRRLNKQTTAAAVNQERVATKSTGGRLGVWERSAQVEQVAME